jgi:formiminoglutamase
MTIVTETAPSNDPLWPRAAHWILPAPADNAPCDIALLGIPAHRTSITPTGAHATPAAVRDALSRYSTYAGSRGVDVSELTALDFGDVAEPDGPEGEARVREAVTRAAANAGLLIALGGDNSITCPVATALAGRNLADIGLITIDAHHDLRDGISNGSPVRRLVEAGLPGRSIVQIGIADFANSVAYAKRAAEYGITVIHRSELVARPLGAILAYALDRAGADGRRVFVDIDVDVCDRAAVPGCPSAAPGGLSAHELRDIAFALASDPRFAGIDITEIDATADAADGRTVRLAALLVLEIATGLAMRAAG